MSEPLLSIREAAQLLGLHPQVLYRLVAARRLPHYRCGRTIRFDRKMLAEHMLVEAGVPR